jgi:hypothetical protein
MNPAVAKPKPLEVTSDKQALIVVRPANKQAEKTYVILGVERGGTSMVAGMIRALGIDLGERSGRNHEDPRFLAEDQDVLKKRIAENNAVRDIWGFKMPKASLMLDFYLQNLRNPHFILVFRNIASVVDSWQTRGGSDPLQTSAHALNYYSTAVDTLSSSGCPLLFANYERGCDQPEDFARSLAEFLDVKEGQSAISKAAAVVTGEGGGYVDLPEFYFHIEALKIDKLAAESVAVIFPGDAEQKMVYGPKKVGDRVILESAGGKFPKNFLLVFTLQASGSFLAEQGLRVYINFTGDFFPGHAFRPPLTEGLNVLRISTHGNVNQIALGSLNQDAVFGLSDVHCLQDVGNIEAEILSVKAVPQRGPFERKLRTIARRVRDYFTSS